VSLSNLQEAELIERCQSHDEHAMAELVTRYQRYVYRLAFHLTGKPNEADDLAQDAFINILRGISSFRGRSSLTSWIYVIVLNTFRDAKRRQARRPETLLEDRPGGAAQAQGAPIWEQTDSLLQEELTQTLQKALTEVPEDFRAVVVLYDVLGYAYEEIAHMLGIPIGTVKSRLHRGRGFLRKRLGSQRDLLQ
jgi:RNA polymerase sigma-70 factor, ECF subfamily